MCHKKLQTQQKKAALFQAKGHCCRVLRGYFFKYNVRERGVLLVLLVAMWERFQSKQDHLYMRTERCPRGPAAMGSWLHDSHDTALLGSAMLDPSQPYIYPPISIHLHLPPAFSSERPGRDAHYLSPSFSPDPPPTRRPFSAATRFLRRACCVAVSYMLLGPTAPSLVQGPVQPGT